MRSLRRLAADESGSAIVELALCATILATMIIGVVDLSNAYSRKLALEQAAQRAIEKVMQTTGENTPADTLKAEAVAQAGGGLTTDKVTVSYSRYCDLVKQDEFSGQCAATEVRALYIAVSIVDEYSPIFPVKFGPVTADGKYRVTAEAGMRTL